MSMNEDVHRMRAQILNLRAAGIACATVIHCFPPCGRPESCNHQCPEAKAALREIYESMNELMLSVRMTLTAVFHPDPEPWDFLWGLKDESTCVERDMAVFGQDFCPDQDDFIKCWGEINNEMLDRLGSGFSEEEWQVLTAGRTWQNGRRLPQVLDLLKYLEDQIRKQFDLLDSVIYSGLLSGCKLGQLAEKRENSVV